MSIPKKHHYLPEFYLQRWTRNGKLVRFYREPHHENQLLNGLKTPAQIGYKPHLYSLCDVDDPVDAQSIESVLFSGIDDRASVALQKFDRLAEPTMADHKALCQFVISLIYRTPSRIKALEAELATKTDGAPYAGLVGTAYSKKLEATARRFLALLVGDSSQLLSNFSKFKAGKIVVSDASKSLLTSDRPLLLSSQLSAQNAYIMLPYAPDRLLILTRHKSIAAWFGSQNHNQLVSGINQAIVQQSENFVVAADMQAKVMIDRLFLRSKPDGNVGLDGLIRRKSPLVMLPLPARAFRRRDKIGMQYLGMQ